MQGRERAERWSNWSGSVEASPAEILDLASEDEVVSAVRRARASGQRVRVVGTGHSGTPLCATEDLLLRLDGLAGLESVDADRRRAWVRAGTKLCDLGDPLLERGLAMENLGDIDKQALAGAIGTGTHGTGRELGNLSTQVEAIRFVAADGGVVAESDPERLRALRVSLGALGVFTSVALRLLPAYRLHERVWREPTEACLETLDEQVASNRHFEFFWLPYKDVAEMKSLNETDAPVDELAEREYERIGWSPHVIASVRDAKFFEMEYAVPAEAGPDCFRALRRRMQERHPDVVWPVEYRRVAADDAWLSPAHGRDTVTLSIHQDGALPYREFFLDVEPILIEAGGRPHWGKVHSLKARELRDRYPAWERFQQERLRLDPEGRFMNGHLQELFES